MSGGTAMVCAPGLQCLDRRAGRDPAHDGDLRRTSPPPRPRRAAALAKRAFDDAAGVKPRRLPPRLAESSGSLITSMARARLGRRRMNPRSSSAVMRRWMPDFERRSSASFISSKEGGTPASFSLSLMKRRSSYCLRVSISSNPPVDMRRSIPTLLFRSRLRRCRQHLNRHQHSKQIMNGHYMFDMCSATI